MQNLLQKLANKLAQFQIKLELGLLLILLIGLLLSYYEISNLIIIISLVLLAQLYFIMAFQLKNIEDAMITFLNKLSYLSFSVGSLGILYTIQHYPGSSLMLTVSLLALIAVLIGKLFLKFRDGNKDGIIDTDMIRIIIITSAITYVMMFEGIGLR